MRFIGSQSCNYIHVTVLPKFPIQRDFEHKYVINLRKKHSGKGVTKTVRYPKIAKRGH